MNDLDLKGSDMAATLDGTHYTSIEATLAAARNSNTIEVGAGTPINATQWSGGD
jgi:hypothetical protein